MTPANASAAARSSPERINSLPIPWRCHSGNTATGSSNGSFQFDGIALRKEGSVTTTNDFGLVGLSPAPATDAQMQSYVRGQNPAEVLGTGGGGALINDHSGSPWTSCTLGF